MSRNMNPINITNYQTNTNMDSCGQLTNTTNTRVYT